MRVDFATPSVYSSLRMQLLKKCFKISFFLLLVLCPLSVVRCPALAAEDTYVIHFVLDGANKKFAHEQMEKGELPNLKKHFFETGAVFENAVTTFPTVSSPGYVAFTTGLSAGNSGIFFLEWFDRTKQKTVGYLTPGGFNKVNTDSLNRLALRDLEQTGIYPPLTLFEQLSPQPSASIYAPFRRGATIAVPKKSLVVPLWNGLVVQDGLALNKTAMKALTKVFSKPVAKIPRYTLVGLYGTDFFGHHSGPRSEEVLLALKQFDFLFGQFLETLAKQGIQDKTYLIVSSDHGMHASGEQLKLRNYLWKKGIRKEDKIYVSNRGVSSTFLYAAGDAGWEEIPNLWQLRNFPARKGPVDLIKTLLENESVDWLAAREDADHIHIFNHKGEGEIFSIGIGVRRFFAYTYKGEDPLRLAQDPTTAPLTDGKPYAEEIWFEKTAQAKKPNAVVEIGFLFQDPRAGDILVAAKDPWSFRSAKAGTHGSLNADDMEIPLWIAGPGVPTGRFGEARGVDLYPTVLNWFGLANEATLKNREGRMLFATKEPAEESETQFWLARLEQELMNLPPLMKLPNKDELVERLRAMLPDHLEAELLGLAQQETDLRYQRWKKLDRLQEKAQNRENPLAVPGHLKKNMDWLFANEKNIEFYRLRRMEDIKTILENP